MNLTEFSNSQRQALLDLAMLATYADGHLTSAEDERIRRLLIAMGFLDEYDWATQCDLAVSRISRHAGTSEGAAAHARKLAQQFATREQRQVVHEILRDVLASDERVSPQESMFLREVREALG